MTSTSENSSPAVLGRVLLVAPESTGGIRAHVADLAAGLVAAGREVVVAAPGSLARRLDVAATGARHVPVPIEWPGRSRDPVGPGDRATSWSRSAAGLGALRPLRREVAAADVVHA
ncbi:MAG TPA: hypothetical protein VFJ12_15015, partial [Segeticoccus sp.]|nr:hypothetical protein [Segeticoccus sp.]